MRFNHSYSHMTRISYLVSRERSRHVPLYQPCDFQAQFATKSTFQTRDPSSGSIRALPGAQHAPLSVCLANGRLKPSALAATFVLDRTSHVIFRHNSPHKAHFKPAILDSGQKTRWTRSFSNIFSYNESVSSDKR